eukprot:6183004-Pleurochrysis_carterae.AAC.1
MVCAFLAQACSSLLCYSQMSTADAWLYSCHTSAIHACLSPAPRCTAEQQTPTAADDYYRAVRAAAFPADINRTSAADTAATLQCS